MFESLGCALSSVSWLDKVGEYNSFNECVIDCFWQHQYAAYEYRDTRSLPQVEPFRLSFIWAPSLSKTSVKQFGKKRQRGYERAVVIDAHTFLNDRMREFFVNNTSSSANVIMFAELHWNHSVYTFWDQNGWAWVKAKDKPGFVLDLETQARRSAYKYLSSRRGIRVYELTQRQGIHAFHYTHQIPSDIVHTPTSAVTNSHWCTEMITWTILKQLLRDHRKHTT